MNIAGMQTELSTIQTEYETLSRKIEQGKKSLISMQEENSQLRQEGLKEQLEVIQEKPVVSTPTSEKTSSKARTVKQVPIQPTSQQTQQPNGGSQLPIEADRDRDGRLDALQENFAGEGHGTISDPDFNLGTNP